MFDIRGIVLVDVIHIATDGGRVVLNESYIKVVVDPVAIFHIMLLMWHGNTHSLRIFCGILLVTIGAFLILNELFGTEMLLPVLLQIGVHDL